jgi:hypothetical protein
MSDNLTKILLIWHKTPINQYPVMKDVFQLVRPDYFEPDTVRRLSVSSNTSTDEPLSSPFKDDKLDPNFNIFSFIKFCDKKFVFGALIYITFYADTCFHLKQLLQYHYHKWSKVNLVVQNLDPICRL